MSRAELVKSVTSLPSPSAALELLKPITWFPPMWAFGCGVASVSSTIHISWSLVCLGVLLCGPLVCGTSQAVNDWFDRHVDAINEPHRPIPSGRIPGLWGLYIAIAWTVLSLAVANLLGPVGFAATVVGLLLAWLYSAPPIRLKRNGWWGNTAVAACYEGLPWITGAAVASASIPNHHVMWMAALYSLGAHGIMTLNDFKSIEGDKRMGIASLPVQLGAEAAARFACVLMLGAQVVVVLLLLHWQRHGFAWAIGVLVAAQVLLMMRLLEDPRARAPWYNATGITLYVAGMLVSAFAVRSLV